MTVDVGPAAVSDLKISIGTQTTPLIFIDDLRPAACSGTRYF